MATSNNRLRASPRFVNQYIGWRNWSVLVYNSAVENVFLFFYIALRNNIGFTGFAANFFIFILFSALCTTAGYLVNDFGDRELDRSHGKANTFADDSTAKAVFIIGSVFASCIVCSLRFAGEPFFIPLFIAWLLITIAYSTKPLRLKERGTAGLFCVVTAQRVLPALLVFAAFGHGFLTDIVIFTLYIFFRGLSSDLNHQLEDFVRDRSSATATFAVGAGEKKARLLFRCSLEAEKLLLFVCLFMLCRAISGFRIFGVSLIMPLLIFYACLYVFHLVKIWSVQPAPDVNPFIPGRRDIFHFLHHAFPSVLFPLYLLFLLSLRDPGYLIILFLFVLYRRLYSLDLLRKSFVGSAVAALFRRGVRS